MVVVIDEKDRRVLEKRLPNDLSLTLLELAPYADSLSGVAVESTFNWYWLVDGLQEAGFSVKLVNTCAVKQYDGLKYSGDRHDAYWLAHLLRLGILPTGYIYPKEERAVRDLLRRRLFLVRSASAQLISVQSQIWRSTGIRIKSADLKRSGMELPVLDAFTRQGVESGLSVYHTLAHEISRIEQTVSDAIKLSDDYRLLQTIRGVGPILAQTIQLEVGDINRFASAGKFASYCRCVQSERVSNGKR
ncbi:MAG: IS110 family transposase, partial [Gammaproteobacteria bacterium]